MSDQQVVFDDWEAEIEKIEEQRQLTVEKGEEQRLERVNEVQVTQPSVTHPQKIVDWHQHHLNQVEKLKKMSEEEFSKAFMSSTDSNEYENEESQYVRMVKPIPLLLKSQKQFTEIAKLMGTRLKNQAEQECDKLLPENEMLTFFEEFLLYLYPSFQWQNLELVKQKIKIVKKDRKEEQARAKKIKEKEERLKRAHKKEEVQLKSVGQVEGCKISVSTGNGQRERLSSKEEEQYY